MIQIPERALLDGVIKQLQGRETFIDTDQDLGERIYSGDVFEAIANELSKMKNSPLYPNKKVVAQINELAKLIDSEYVQIIMI